MRIEVRGRAVSLSQELREKLVRLVLLALSRFGPQVRKVTVSLSVPVNPLGGVDQQCRLRARLRDRDDLHAEAIDGGLEAAVTRAAAQLAQRLDATRDGGASDAADLALAASGRRTVRSRRRTPLE